MRSCHQNPRAKFMTDMRSHSVSFAFSLQGNFQILVYTVRIVYFQYPAFVKGILNSDIPSCCGFQCLCPNCRACSFLKPRLQVVRNFHSIPTVRDKFQNSYNSKVNVSCCFGLERNSVTSPSGQMCIKISFIFCVQKSLQCYVVICYYEDIPGSSSPIISFTNRFQPSEGLNIGM